MGTRGEHEWQVDWCYFSAGTRVMNPLCSKSRVLHAMQLVGLGWIPVPASVHRRLDRCAGAAIVAVSV